MPTFTTFFRAAVMIATGILVVKGWQLYGPSAEQMKSFAGRAIELAHESWNGSDQAESNGSLAADPQGLAASFAPAADRPAFASGTADAPHADLGAAPAFAAPVAPAVFADSTAAEEPALAASDKMAASEGIEGDRMAALLAHLEQLGGVEPQLVAWGSSGRLYRFSCRAALADSPSFSRHFESVAAEPLVAVEEVVAQVEGWRTARRDEGLLR